MAASGVEVVTSSCPCHVVAHGAGIIAEYVFCHITAICELLGDGIAGVYYQ